MSNANHDTITDELRKYAMVHCHSWLREKLLAIADRIDAEHERRMAGVMVDKMAERGWIRLHKGVDGEYIREGDKVEWRSHDGVWQKATTVAAVCGDGCYINLGGLVVHVSKFDIRRYHEPTVEDVLREFADKVCSGDHFVKDGTYHGIEDTDLLAEYAAKLRLAGDAE